MTVTKLDIHLTLRPNGTITTDHESEVAVLGSGDTLTIGLGAMWPTDVGIKRVDFYPTPNDKATGPSGKYWLRGSSNDVSDWFEVTSENRNTSTGKRVFFEVTIRSQEQPSVNKSRWYKVTMDNGAVLDPEVINKAGEGGGRWTPQAQGGRAPEPEPEIRTMPPSGERVE